MEIAEIQKLMKTLYEAKDLDRGLDKTLLWFISEVGELAEIIAKNNIKSITDIDQENKKKLKNELADCFAWLLSISNLLQIDIQEAIIEKYPFNCPKCAKNPCACKLVTQ